ncbi:MAG: phage holin family protein [Burkholderiales bacterium]|nr:phage holin family protein [Burkholderiales bacterium]
MADPVAGAGLLRSLRRLTDSALEIVQVRLALLGTEFEQEKQRLFDALLRAVLGLLLLALALVLAVAFVLLLLQEAYRLPALGVLALAFGVAAASLLRSARAALQSGPGGPFALSLAELRQDRASVGGEALPSEKPVQADRGPGAS